MLTRAEISKLCLSSNAEFIIEEWKDEIIVSFRHNSFSWLINLNEKLIYENLNCVYTMANNKELLIADAGNFQDIIGAIKKFIKNDK